MEATGRKSIPVLIVTGPVGTGKTTVAAAISAELERRSVAGINRCHRGIKIFRAQSVR